MKRIFICVIISVFQLTASNTFIYAQGNLKFDFIINQVYMERDGKGDGTSAPDPTYKVWISFHNQPLSVDQIKAGIGIYGNTYQCIHISNMSADFMFLPVAGSPQSQPIIMAYDGPILQYNLDGGLYMNIYMECHENDNPPDCEFVNGDDWPDDGYVVRSILLDPDNLGDCTAWDYAYTNNGWYGLLFNVYNFSIDALAPTLNLRNSANQPQAFFCEGDPIRWVAQRTGQAYAGYFEWQISHDEGNTWQAYGGSSVIDDFIPLVASQNMPMFRTRLVRNCPFGNLPHLCWRCSDTAFSNGTGTHDGWIYSHFDYIIAPPPPDADQLTISVSRACGDAYNGEIQVDAIDLDPSYEYDLILYDSDDNVIEAVNGIENTETYTHLFSNLQGGDYEIRVTLRNVGSSPNFQCTSAPIPANVPMVVPPAIVDIATTDAICFDGQGSVLLSFPDGQEEVWAHLSPVANPAASLQLGPSTGSVVFQNVPSGLFEVWVNYIDACFSDTLSLDFAPRSLDVTIEPVTLQNSSAHVSCDGVGQIIITPVFLERWCNVYVDDILVGTLLDIPLIIERGAGTYQIAVIPHGCSENATNIESKSIELIGVPPLALNLPEITNGSCSNDNTVLISLVSGQMGTAPITYQIRNINTNFTIIQVDEGQFNFLPNGPYEVWVTDATGCFREQFFEATGSGTLTGVITEQSEHCDIWETGTITVQGFGGTPPYLYTDGFVPFSTVNTFEYFLLISGIIYVKDQTECIVEVPFGWDIPNQVRIRTEDGYPKVVALDCESLDRMVEIGLEGRDGQEVEISFDNGVNWEDIDFEQTQDDIVYFPIDEPGVYTYRVRVKGDICTSEDVFLTFYEPIPFEIQSFWVSQESCPGSQNSSVFISVEVEENFLPITFELWRQDQSGQFAFVESIVLPFGQTGTSFGSFEDGIYFLKAFRSDGCQVSSEEFEIMSVTPVTASLQSIGSNIFCSGNNGVIEVSNITGGTPPFTYSLNDGTFQGSPILTNADLENTVSIKDFNNCTYGPYFLSIEPEPNTLSMALTEVRQIIPECSEGGSGILHAQVVPGLPPYQTAWAISEEQCILLLDSQSASSELNYQFQSNAAGLYHFCAKDSAGCVDVSSILLTEGAPLEMNFVAEGTVCLGDSNGSILIDATGGAPPYRLVLNNSSDTLDIVGTQYSFLNLGAGTYRVELIDSRQCVFDRDIIVPSLSALSVDAIVTDVSPCSDDANGSISLNPNGGASPYTIRFLWDGEEQTMDEGQGPVIRQNLTVGVYQVRIEDALGCELEFTYGVSGPEEISIQISQEDATCEMVADGYVEVVSFTPASSNFSYSIGGDFTASSVFSGLANGQYTLTAMDENGCSISIDLEIGIKRVMAANSFPSDPLCHGDNSGLIGVSVSMAQVPLRYSLNQGPEVGNFSTSFIISDLTSGSYDLRVIDQDGCFVDMEDIQLSDPPILDLQVEVIEDATCDQPLGTLEGIASGGTAPYDYTWNGNPILNSSVLSAVPHGIYTLVVNDFNGCTASASGQITDFPQILLDIEELSPEFCDRSDGLILLNTTGGLPPFAYEWSHDTNLDEPLATSLSAGSYEVTVSDANFCSQSIIIEVPFTPAVQISWGTIVPSLCEDGIGELEVEGAMAPLPFLYSWSHDPNLSSSFASNLNAGVYTVTVEDGNQCTAELSAEIIYFSPPELDYTFSPSNCMAGNGSIAVAVNPGTGTPPYNYVWSHDPLLSSNIAENLEPGSYSVTVSDIMSCTAVIVHEVEELSGPIATPTVGTSTCNEANGSISLFIQGGVAPYQVLWDNGMSGSELQGLEEGFYSFTLTDFFGCETSSVVEVSGIDGIVQVAATVQDSYCQNNSGGISLTVEGGTAPYQYKWSHNALLQGSQAFNLSSGIYGVTVSDAIGCTFLISVEVGLIPGPNIEVLSIGNSLCVEGNGHIAISATGEGNLNYEWTFGISAGPQANQLSSGTYRVTVTDENACSTVQNFLIELEQAPAISIFDQGEDLCDAQVGFIILETMGGASPFQFEWSHDSELNENFATDLAAGIYTISVSDANGCTSMFSHEVLAISGPFLEIAEIQQAGCGSSNGAIYLNLSGGQGDVQIVWSHDPQNTGLFAEGLSPGLYIISAIDEQDCAYYRSIVIHDSAPPQLSVQSISEDPCTANDVSIQLSVAGGKSPFVYSWSHDVALDGNVADYLSTGDYTVSIVDAYGCVDSLSISITDNYGPQITDLNTMNSSCGNEDGTVLVSVEALNLPVSYEWSHDINAVGQAQDGLAAGHYQVSITDQQECVTIISFNISDEGGPNVEVVSIQESVCQDGNGSISLEILEPEGIYTLNWSHHPDNNELEATNLSAGFYVVTVADENLCKTVLSFDIDFIEGPSLDLTVLPAHCNDDNGSLSLDISGGVEPYEINWSNSEWLGAATLDGLASGLYQVSVTDSNGCLEVFDFEIPQIQPFELILGSIEDENCNQSDGVVNLSILGGEAPYVYSWSHDALLNLPTALNLIAGEYSVTSTDALGCTRDLIVFVDEVSLSTFNVLMQEEDCGLENGIILIEAQPEGVGYEYSWAHDSQLMGAQAEGLSSGVYIVTITDLEGCSSVLTNHLQQNSDLSLEILNTQNPSCNQADGIIAFGYDGGQGDVEVSWSHDTELQLFEANQLPAGTYVFVITDSSGCSVSAVVDLVEEVADVSVSTENSLCGASLGAASATFIEGAEYRWTSLSDPNFLVVGSNEIEQLPAASYLLEVWTADLCLIEKVFTIEDSNPLLLEYEANSACNGSQQGEIEVWALSGGLPPLNYEWSHDSGLNSNIVSDLAPGFYQVTVSDANSCSSTLEILVEELANPNVEVSFLEQPNCSGSVLGAIGLSVMGGAGGYLFQWSDSAVGNVAFSGGLDEGYYTITVTDAAQCETVVEVNLEAEIDFQATVQSIIGPSCFGGNNGSASVLIQGGGGGFTFLWSDELSQNTPLASNLAAGLYAVSITNNLSGCVIILEVPITEPQELGLDILEITPEQCFGTNNASIRIRANGGTGPYSYIWNDEGETQAANLLNVPPGVYEVTVTDLLQCSYIEEFELLEAEPILATLEITNGALCQGDNTGSILASVSGGTAPYTFRWSDSALQNTPEAINLTSGNYTVTITDSNNCTSTQSIELPASLPINLELVETENPNCAGSADGSIVIDANGGEGELSFLWSNGTQAPVLSGVGAGIYSVTVTDSNFCTKVAQFQLTSPLSLFISQSNIQSTSCYNSNDGSISFEVQGGVPPYFYTWNDEALLGESTVSQLLRGNYIVTITDSNNCELVRSYSIGSDGAQILINTALFPPDCEGADNGFIQVQLLGGNGPLQITWENGANDLERTNLSSGSYQAVVNDGEGCTEYLEVLLTEGPALEVSLGPRDTVLCQGMVLFYDFNGFDYQIQWSSSGGFASNESQVALDGSDTYMVEVVNGIGCAAKDTITVNVLPEPLQAFFIIATDVLVDEEVVAVEVSWPIPDLVEWYYSEDSVQFVRQENDAYIFKFLHVGETRLGMKSSVGGCEDWIHKFISVHSDSSSIPGLNPDLPEILSVNIAPNPNSGNFLVNVELSVANQLAMNLYDNSGSPISRRILQGSLSYSEQYSHALTPGTYFLILQTPRQRRTFTISVIP